ncbi:MAG TPA: type I-C CRISPR-associated protein Cas7/Csd2 [Anaerolineaceae bacterium]|nr:type I-C CRISPR-associated protein Cas7/Csd2 [Anaerolineaceae bacterium]HNZ15232.1 type I-C CRISPR-associated protein Cas7/Csd2 [Anaerolineaceae bacterium]HQN68914.1 type I-C CRISPR-associated protein Cas7/Csd2 [Anaerolineaceae bacterium]
MENKTPLSNRYEFVLFYDVENGNPNGDPDAGNMPRIDPETGYGIVTDVCLKRKIRNYVDIIKSDQPGFQIYVTEGIALNSQHLKAYTETNTPLPKQAKNVPADDLQKVRKWMCDNFYDVRTFGAVMTTGVNCGQVRGPVQLNFSRSLDPIMQQEVTITRVTVTRPEDEKTTEMGRKHIVPYALYRVEGYISPALANHENKGTGFSEEDLELLWLALENMFEFDRSASRGKMASRKLFIFKHDSDLGNAPSHKLFDLITHELDQNKVVPRQFSDYTIHVDRDNIPQGVKLIERL